MPRGKPVPKKRLRDGLGGNMRTTSPADSVPSVLGGHRWASGQGLNPPKPFHPLMQNIQEGNDMAKQGRGVVGAHWPGDCSSPQDLPCAQLARGGGGGARPSPSAGSGRGAAAGGAGPPPERQGTPGGHQGSSASSSSSSDATPEEATSETFRRSGKSLLSTTSSSAGERQASA